ncbi:MAG TPA: hypothetical protein ENH82_05260 [bacterium]|nr:hypothetical protein [bacterium]
MIREEEVLLKALDKAVVNGFDKKQAKLWRLNILEHGYFSYSGLMFLPDFCKAFWGDDFHEYDNIPKWKYHIKQLAIAEDRIEYIAKFL